VNSPDFFCYLPFYIFPEKSQHATDFAVVVVIVDVVCLCQLLSRQFLFGPSIKG